jgi:hypothetical protein
METFLIPVFILACPLLLLVFSALLLYVIPVRFTLFLRQTGKEESSITVSWGTIRVRIIKTGEGQRTEVILGGNILYSLAGKEKWREGKEVKSPSPADFRLSGGYLTHIPRMIEPLGKFGLLLWHQTTLEDINGRIRIGTGDPVATGLLYGGYWATRCMLRESRIFIEVIPEFDGKILEMDLVVRLRINNPLRILIAGMRLSRDPAVRKGLTGMKPHVAGVSES